MKVRPVEDRDVEGLIALWEACELLRPWNDPVRDIERARASPQTEIFVIGGKSAIIASAMVGHDGHRGWLYYVATDPGRRGEGLARLVMDRCESWLKSLGVPKVQLMTRKGNPATGFYAALGYEFEARSVMAKWLEEPVGKEQLSPQKVTVTYLEMREAPARPPAPQPRISGRLALLRVSKPSVGYYRYLYNAVGAEWCWYERNLMQDDELAGIIEDERVEIYVLYAEGAPAGYTELDFRDPADVELAFFGLLSDYIGLGLGTYLLDWSIDTAWSRQPDRLWVNTCTLDHPSALRVYQKAGFEPYRQETIYMPYDITGPDRI